MSAIRLRFELLGWWHAGTGRGDGARADAVVRRSHGGLPFLPGRTAKGLLRDACGTLRDLGRVRQDELVAWFGSELLSRTKDAEEEARYTSVPGALRFSSATLGAEWEAWGASRGDTEDHRRLLFGTLASTAVDEEGVARDATLRTIEVAVPVALIATVEGPDDPRWIAGVRESLPLIRAVGAHRTRGLGRVAVTEVR